MKIRYDYKGIEPQELYMLYNTTRILITQVTHVYRRADKYILLILSVSIFLLTVLDQFADFHISRWSYRQRVPLGKYEEETPLLGTFIVAYLFLIESC